jgi:hypothetical protein
MMADSSVAVNAQRGAEEGAQLLKAVGRSRESVAQQQHHTERRDAPLGGRCAAGGAWLLTPGGEASESNVEHRQKAVWRRAMAAATMLAERTARAKPAERPLRRGEPPEKDGCEGRRPGADSTVAGEAAPRRRWEEVKSEWASAAEGAAGEMTIPGPSHRGCRADMARHRREAGSC